ncbi:hypothetical protein MBLNU13_g01498t1 [Cladosporium sp. NU13]
MCLFPFLVVWERCGCTAYRVMETCSEAGSGEFAICCKSLYEATQDESILEERGGCLICHNTIYVPFPAGSFETPTSDETKEEDQKK